MEEKLTAVPKMEQGSAGVIGNVRGLCALLLTDVNKCGPVTDPNQRTTASAGLIAISVDILPSGK
jgi:hypothetical protein